MTINYGVLGAFTIDNVINQYGDISVHQCGGNAYYGAAGARLWSNDVGVVAIIGEDYPRAWVEDLKQVGVDISCVRETPGQHLMHGGMMKYDTRGDRIEIDPHEYFGNLGQAIPAGMLQDFPYQFPKLRKRAQIEFTPDTSDISTEFLKASNVQVAACYYKKHLDYLNLLKSKNIRVFLDPGIWYMNVKNIKRVASLFKNVDVILPSEVEVKSLFGNLPLSDAAITTSNFGPRIVVIKIGSEGSLVYDKQQNKIMQIPVFPAKVIDPTGAGDSFCGGFMVGYAETGDPFLAAMYGTISSSFIVEGFGASYSFKFSRTQAEERLNQLIELTKNQVTKNRDNS